MKKIRLLFTILCLLPAIFALGQTTLTFRLANPGIYYDGATNYFQFDIQMKAAVGGTYLWSGQAILNFDNSNLSTNAGDWIVSKGPLIQGTYGVGSQKYIDPILTLTGTPLKLNIAWAGPSGNLQQATYTRFNEVTTSFQTVVTVYAPIANQNGVAGIDFYEPSMNGQQSYKLLADPWYAGYVNPNLYDPADFMNIYLGRIYSSANSWTQYVALNWNTAINTSVWDGTATIPAGSLSKASAMRIHTGAVLDIPVTGQLTAASVENNTSNGLMIHSDATGTGSLIAGTVSGTGTTNAQRYMTTGAWHLLSSPLSGQTVANFLTTNANISTNGSNRGMADYSPAGNIWNPFFTDGLANGSLGSGKGFLVRDIISGTITFTGSLQVGTQPAAAVADKWNCVGNPYTSAIGISANGGTNTANFLTENASNIDPAYGIYIWDQPDASNGQTGKYTAVSNVPNPFDPAFSVQQGQGFFVKMQVTKTSVNFLPTMQFHNPTLALKSTQVPWPTIKLDALVNNQESSTFISFNSGMTNGLDPTYDAGLFKGGADLAIYTRLVKDIGIPFAIQALPDKDFNNLIIPVGLDSKSGGDVVFSAESFNLPADCKVILEDKLNNTFTNLSINNYKTSIATNSSISDRFFLHTSSAGLDKTFNQADLIVYTVDKNIFISGKVTTQAHFRIYNTLGQNVGEMQATSEILNVLDGSALRPGTYVLNIRDKDRNESVKFVFGN